MKPGQIIILLIFAALFYGCGKDKTRRDYSAKVNDSFLLIEDVEKRAADSPAARSEYIRNWVETEVLYLEGVDNDILDDENYHYLIEKSKRELVKSIWLQKFFEKQNVSFSQKELENFFVNNPGMFKSIDNAYHLNLISFYDESSAARFRTTLMESNWDKAYKSFATDSLILNVINGQLVYKTAIYEGNLLRIIESMTENEISLVIPVADSKFYVVQLIKRINKGEIPPFNAVQKEVERLFVEEKKRTLLREYMKELYAKYEIEIRK